MAAGTTAPPGARRQPVAPHPLLARLDSPLTSYYLLVGATLALTCLGLMMVLSSSSVVSLKNTGSAYGVFVQQALFGALALPLMLVASRLPIRIWKALAWPGMLVAVVGLALVLSPLGHGTKGNRNWLVLGGITLQPSEAAKLAFVVWAAAVLARKRALLGRAAHAVVPVVVPGAVLLLGLVLAGHDLGTGLVLVVLLAALLWGAGAPRRIFVVGGVLLLVLVTVLATLRQSRLQRIMVWFSGACEDPQNYLGTCWQPVHGKWAMASGGWWGLGLGASKEKWSWLPEPHNDFIFAIIGEELGLAGTLAVLALFALLGAGLLRVVLRSDDPFVKIATGGVMAWVLGQAAVNIGAVVGIFPVIGVPLPLVSSGGSALVTTLIALGMVIGFARREPGAAEALAARAVVVRRSLAVVPGRPEARRARGKEGAR